MSSEHWTSIFCIDSILFAGYKKERRENLRSCRNRSLLKGFCVYIFGSIQLILFHICFCFSRALANCVCTSTTKEKTKFALHSFVCEQSMELRHEWAIVLLCWHTRKKSANFISILVFASHSVWKYRFIQSVNGFGRITCASIAQISRSNPLLIIQNTKISCVVDWLSSRAVLIARGNRSQFRGIDRHREREKKLFKDFVRNSLRIPSQWIANTTKEDIYKYTCQRYMNDSVFSAVREWFVTLWLAFSGYFGVWMWMSTRIVHKWIFNQIQSCRASSHLSDVEY